MPPSDDATAEVGKYRPENLAGMVLRACVLFLPAIVFLSEARSQLLSEVTARGLSQTTHRARRAQPSSFQGSSEDHGGTLKWRS